VQSGFATVTVALAVLEPSELEPVTEYVVLLTSAPVSQVLVVFPAQTPPVQA
jgi:hypothetical protein